MAGEKQRVLHATDGGGFYYGEAAPDWHKNIRGFGEIRVSGESAMGDVDGLRARERLRGKVALNLLRRQGYGGAADYDVEGTHRGGEVGALVREKIMRTPERLDRSRAVASMDYVRGGERQNVNFYEFDDFDPVVSPRNENVQPSLALKSLNGHYTKRMDIVERNRGTYWKTQELGEKADKELMNVVTEYLWRTERGKRLAMSLGIENRYDLLTLTPRQAIGLSNQIVMELSEYDYDAVNTGVNPADKMSAVDLLKNGLQLDGKGGIKALGVCRNYADAAGLVFEMLKKMQDPQFNRLESTFVIWSLGDEDEYSYRRNIQKTDHGWHAWNTYVTQMMDGSAAMVTMDPTWKREGENGELAVKSYTAMRLEKMMRDIYNKSGGEKVAKNVRSLSEFYLREMLGSKGAGRDYLLGAGASVLGARVELDGGSEKLLTRVVQMYSELLRKVVDGTYKYTVAGEDRRVYSGVFKFANAVGARGGADLAAMRELRRLLGDFRAMIK